MKKIVLPVLLLISFNASAEITTRAEADLFLNKYCIGLVSEIEKAVESQVNLAKKEDWQNFNETGKWISGLSDIYSKLCK